MNLLGKAAIASTARYLKTLEAARKIDPKAFEPVMLPHFTDQQLWDQRIAIDKAVKEMGGGD